MKQNWVKKLICAILCLLVVAYAAYDTVKECSYYAPDETSVRLGTKDEDGNNYCYFSSSYTTGLYKVNNRGKVTASSMQTATSGWGNGQVVSLKYLKKTLYMLLNNQGTLTFYTMDKEFNIQRSVQLEFEESGFFGGVSDDGKIMYLSLIKNNGRSVFVYRLDSSDKAPKDIFSADAPDGLRYLNAYYNQGTIEARYSDGSTTENYEQFATQEIVVPESTKMFALQGGIGYAIRDLFSACIAVFCVIFGYSMIVNKKSYIWRRFVLIVLLSLVCVTAMTLFLYYVIGVEREQDILDFMYVCNYNIGDEITNEDDDYKVLYSNRNKLDLINRVDIITGEDGDYTIRASLYEPAGASVREVYGDLLCDAIYEATSSGKAYCEFFMDGYASLTAVSVVPKDVSKTSFVVSYGEESVYVDKTYNDAFRVILISYSIWIVGMVAIFINLLRDSREIRKVTKTMENVCNGKSPEIERPKTVAYDYAKLWNALGELNKTIGKNNYARNQIFQAYYRFAPKNIEKLLEKDNIGDVKSGDMIRVNGVVGIVAMSRPVVRNQNEYLESINNNIETICRYQTEFNGVLLPNDCSLSSVKVLFTEKSDRSVDFGIQTASALEASSSVTRQHSLVLLHRTSFFYGIAGTDNQAFPCISSSELDGVDSYVSRLAELGVKLAITEPVLQSTMKNLNTRYIGYLEIKSSSTLIKLYEVIDACSIRERKTKTDTKDLFQKGIDLYYRNDFYLARNTFTDVLKLSPEDMVAKWYLFTCEKQLNNPSGDDFTYGLLSERR